MRPVTGNAAWEGKPETFNFLGFTPLLWATPQDRKTFTVWRITAKKRMVAKKLKAIKRLGFERRKHDRTSQVGVWLRSVVTGYYQYHAGSPATSINCASSEVASIDCGETYWSVVVNSAREEVGEVYFGLLGKGGYHHPAFFTLIPTPRFYATHSFIRAVYGVDAPSVRLLCRESDPLRIVPYRDNFELKCPYCRPRPEQTGPEQTARNSD